VPPSLNFPQLDFGNPKWVSPHDLGVRQEFFSKTDPLLLFRMIGKGQPLALRKTRRQTIRKTLTAIKSLESVKWTVENPPARSHRDI
jgi:hypothetical protein